MEYDSPKFKKWLDKLQQESWQLELIISRKITTFNKKATTKNVVAFLKIIGNGNYFTIS